MKKIIFLIIILVLLILFWYLKPFLNKKLSLDKNNQNCPDRWVINKMPTVGRNNIPRQYYIYNNGQSQEVNPINAAWVKINCHVSQQVVE